VRRVLIALALATTLSGCAVVPAYPPPPSPVVGGYPPPPPPVAVYPPPPPVVVRPYFGFSYGYGYGAPYRRAYPYRRYW
jgi:hypothetical protein